MQGTIEDLKRVVLNTLKLMSPEAKAKVRESLNKNLPSLPKKVK